MGEVAGREFGIYNDSDTPAYIAVFELFQTSFKFSSNMKHEPDMFWKSVKYCCFGRY